MHLSPAFNDGDDDGQAADANTGCVRNGALQNMQKGNTRRGPLFNERQDAVTVGG
jgi:hypothetical protein